MQQPGTVSVIHKNDLTLKWFKKENMMSSQTQKVRNSYKTL